jgi:CheY-like chemotaxis protein
MPTKILAIDDSKTMRLAIKITFAAEDCEVVAVSKGSEAVARAKQMPADVLIVDANLAAGEPSGYDVARAGAGRPGHGPHPGACCWSRRRPGSTRARSRRPARTGR